MHARFDHDETVAENIRSFWFRPEKPVQFVAGQFTELSLPHNDADSRGYRRWFTISSSPTEPLIGITTKLSLPESSTFKRQLCALRPGTPLTLADPMGDFVLPKDTSLPLVFVIGGIGVTPVRSMVKYLLDSHEQRDIRIVYAVSRPEEAAFLPLFAAYNLPLTLIVTKPHAAYTGERGRLTAHRIRDLIPDDDHTLYYLSGPEPMVEVLTKELHQTGIDSLRIVTDYFHGYQPL